jgi:glycosyltransferase involved in cell wall biosynthesis
LLLGFEIVAENKNIELIIAGDGECKNEYQELVSKFRNKNKIHFLGSYDYQTLPQILAKSDIGVIPYQINDFNNYTIHNKVFDYFALGKPVLVSLANPLVRVINETKAGLAMDFSNEKSSAFAIEEILNADIETMSKNALEAAQNKYNWDVDAKILCDFITSFMNF